MEKYRPTVYSKDDIQAEYDLSSRSDREFEMVKWGSHEKMCNRFRLVLEVIDFNSVDKWLAKGNCGSLSDRYRNHEHDANGMYS